MTIPVFASVVEGHGEVSALRPLIYNILTSIGGDIGADIRQPYRAHWGSIVNRAGELEDIAERALQECGPDARLLVLIDADDRCPAELGPALLDRLSRRFPNRPVSVNVANWEFETWFIAGFETIAAHLGAHVELELPKDIESIEDPKGWLTRNVIGRRYRETQDQPSFCAVMDVEMARRRSESFDRFCREVQRLLAY